MEQPKIQNASQARKPEAGCIDSTTAPCPSPRIFLRQGYIWWQAKALIQQQRICSMVCSGGIMRIMTRMGTDALKALSNGEFVKCLHSVGCPLPLKGRED